MLYKHHKNLLIPTLFKTKNGRNTEYRSKDKNY